MPSSQTKKIAVVGSGVAGLSAAWLLSKRHRVTLFEADTRIGGHGHTVDVSGPSGTIPVDTGFIVYNEATYPNLTALLDHLRVPTRGTSMSFAVSLDDGALEYAGSDLAGLLAQKSNLLRPRFWSMIADLLRFYREAPRDLPAMGMASLDDYLSKNRYGAAFRDDHLYPMASAIWSTPAGKVGDYPAASFVRFCENHGLLKLAGRPIWRTIVGGSRVYIEALAQGISGGVLLDAPVESVRREAGGARLRIAGGREFDFDHVVLATHADRSLAILDNPTPREQSLLGAFQYARNEAVLHGDASFMPRRRAAWASWNYSARRDRDAALPCVTYWMNNLQGLESPNHLLVTLNPSREPAPGTVLKRMTYEHPLFDARAILAQRELWSLQGQGGVWFCGAYFGAGFHEDGLQAGLAVAEQLGGERRPWRVTGESARIGPITPVIDAVVPEAAQ